MEKTLGGKVAIVTGAGQGIGRATALRLARAGTRLVVAEYDAATAATAVQEIEAAGGQAGTHPVDISNLGAVRQMVTDVATQFGHIDILVNNAGLTQIKPMMELVEEDWDRIVQVNERGLFFCLQATAAQMIRQVPGEVKAAGRADKTYGKIVNVTSISGQRGRSDAAHYAASKAAVISITQSAALALAPYGINVNAVSPGVVATPMWKQIDLERGRLTGARPGEAMAAFVEKVPLKRPAQPDDVAAAIAFLCSPDSDYITGHTLNVDGGYEMR